MHRPIIAFTTLWMLLLFLLFVGIHPTSAYPISQLESQITVHIPSDVQKQGSTPTPLALFPRDHAPLPSETVEPQATTTSTVVEETQIDDQPPKEVSSEDKTTADGEDEDDEEKHHGLNSNVAAGITVGVVFGVLLIIAAFMYAFRVGWEKGQRQQEKTKKASALQPPAPPMLEPWHQVDVIRPPDILLETGSSCWDSGSWSCCGDHIEKYQTIGERYSFRPGKGVYEIRDSDREGAGEPKIRPMDGSYRTDSGVGLDHEGRKGKERENL